MSAASSISPLVIAEAGVNHNGDMARALDMVDAAAESGADIVKFQAFRAEDLVAAGTGTAAYQAANTGQSDQLAMLRALELSRDDFASVAARCRDQGIGFLATAFDVDFVEALLDMGMDRIKVASGELTNAPALRRFAGLGVPVILSTGMATMAEVEGAVATLLDAGLPRDRLTVLQCTSTYPAPPEEANLLAMVAMGQALDVAYGYSDHTMDDHLACAAVALGASVIEKHFTLDRALPGPDHAASLEPDELARMIGRLRDVAAGLGDGEKRPSASERDTAALVRRSWHAARDLPAGAVIGPGDVALKRPADGLAPDAPPYGRRLRAGLAADAPVTAKDLAETANG